MAERYVREEKEVREKNENIGDRIVEIGERGRRGKTDNNRAKEGIGDKERIEIMRPEVGKKEEEVPDIHDWYLRKSYRLYS